MVSSTVYSYLQFELICLASNLTIHVEFHFFFFSLQQKDQPVAYAETLSSSPSWMLLGFYFAVHFIVILVIQSWLGRKDKTLCSLGFCSVDELSDYIYSSPLFGSFQWIPGIFWFQNQSNVSGLPSN